MALIAPILLGLALAAAPAPGEPAAAAPARPAAELWLRPSGAEAGAEEASPEGAAAWAGLLAREGSSAAASRAWEALARRWPGAPQAEPAVLSAARGALAAGEFDRALKLVAEMRARWLAGPTAAERDILEVAIGEARLAEADRGAASARDGRRHVEAALKVYAGILKRDRAGPAVERATLGRARALARLGRRTKAVETLEVFLREFPRSPLVAEARRELAAVQSGRARGRSAEREALAGASAETGYAREHLELQAAGAGAADAAGQQAIRDTYLAIAARQAELKIDEARLYIRLKKPRAAEWVLRSVLRRYGDTPSAREAAELLEELAGE